MNSKSVEKIRSMMGHRGVPTILNYLSVPGPYCDNKIKSDFRNRFAAALDTFQEPSKQTELQSDIELMEDLTKEENNE